MKNYRKTNVCMCVFLPVEQAVHVECFFFFLLIGIISILIGYCMSQIYC